MRITTVAPAFASAAGEAPARPAAVPGAEAAPQDQDAGDADDAPAAAGALAVGPQKTKPKRPLSGYNLFYRYKRLKVLEATSKSRRGRPHPTSAGAAASLDEPDDSALIRAVLVALPGLEGLPASSPVWSLPRPGLDDARCANIRRDMEGRLFPNENARNRLHRKVHGMGFVEMGKTMRDMWARIDPATKDVFCELADVGRVRYRTLLAEFRAGQAAAGGPAAAVGGGKKKEGKKPSYEKAGGARRVKKACLPSKDAPVATMTATTTTPKAADKPAAVLPGLVPPTPQGQAPVIAHRRDSMMSIQSLQPLSVHAVPATNPPRALGVGVQPSTGGQDGVFRFGRRVSDNSLALPGGNRRASTGSAASSMASLNMMAAGTSRRATTDSMASAPLPLPPRRCSADSSMASLNNVASRRSSTDSAASLDAMAGELQELQELQRFLLRNAQQNATQGGGAGNAPEGVDGAMQMQLSMLRELQQLQDLQALQRRRELQATQAQGGSSTGGMNVAGVLPPPLFQTQQQSLFANANPAGQKASPPSAWAAAGADGLSVCPADVLSSKASPAEGKGEGVSAQDFMDFIGQLDEAIDHHCDNTGARIERRVPAVQNAVEGQGPNPGPQGPQGGPGGEDAFHPSFIFGNPIHDVPRNQNVQGGQKGGSASVVPMPAAYELHTKMARMA